LIGSGSIKVGSAVVIRYGAIIDSQAGEIVIGDRTALNPYCIVYGARAGVRIGRDVAMAAHTMIVPSQHRYEILDIPVVDQGTSSKGIIIGDNVWIGANCVIMDGVTIGNGAIIGAGSVVNRDVKPFEIAAGVPARTIKSRLDSLDKELSLKARQKA
jgi:acetyltransferase-like isoleucine patch superfamily enzyme